MRRFASNEPAPVDPAGTPRSDWTTLKRLGPYLWEYRVRMVLALVFVVAAKAANVGVPLLLKQLVDSLSIPIGDPRALVVVPLGLLLAYAGLRLSTTVFTELRELVFAKATHGAARRIALETFRHLHALSLRFHLDRQTGGMTRDIERGTRALQSLVSYSLYTIVPTLVELTLVLTLLGSQFDMGFVWITLAALVAYGTLTISLTEWRTQFRREMNELDSKAHSRAVDALLNYETDMAEGLKAMALEGHGLAFLPASSVRKEVSARRLVPAGPRQSGAAFEVTIEVRLYRERPEVSRHNKPAAQALWEFLRVSKLGENRGL